MKIENDSRVCRTSVVLFSPSVANNNINNSIYRRTHTVNTVEVDQMANLATLVVFSSWIRIIGSKYKIRNVCVFVFVCGEYHTLGLWRFGKHKSMTRLKIYYGLAMLGHMPSKE